MTNYLTLTEFVPGTKAKAQEVNANFSALKDAVNTKASLDGDSTQVFSVANATLSSHAVNKSQLAQLSEDLTSELDKAVTKFCAKSGNTASGLGDLFSYSSLNVTPKIGGTYQNLIIADYKGVLTTITSAQTFSMSGKPNGVHNIFISSVGTLYTLNNTIYRQVARPTMLAGDVWLNTSVEPFSCIKYSGTADIEFLDVPLGSVTIASGAITKIETFQYNQNGYDVNFKTQGYRFPNYTNPVSKLINTAYTAECDGWLYCESQIQSYLTAGYVYCTINSVQKLINSCTGDNADFNANLAIIPVSNGDTYTFSSSGGNLNTFNTKFYTAKGAI